MANILGFHHACTSLKVRVVSSFIRSVIHGPKRLYKLCIYLINRCPQWRAKKCFTISSWDGKGWWGAEEWRLWKALSCHTCRFYGRHTPPGPIPTKMKSLNIDLAKNANNQLLQSSSSISLDTFPAHMLYWQITSYLRELSLSLATYRVSLWHHKH